MRTQAASANAVAARLPCSGADKSRTGAASMMTSSNSLSARPSPPLVFGPETCSDRAQRILASLCRGGAGARGTRPGIGAPSPGKPGCIELFGFENLARLGVPIFCLDSILSAIAITKVFSVLATAIVDSGALMSGEGGHEAQLQLFGTAVEPMATTTFYFAIFVLVAVAAIRFRYRNQLTAERAASQRVMA